MDEKISKKPYSRESRERAVRLFLEHRPEYANEVAALRALAGKRRSSVSHRRPEARLKMAAHGGK